MSNIGWVKISRRTLDHWVYDGSPMNSFGAWIDLLLMANYADSKERNNSNLEVTRRGEVFTSIEKLKVKWGRGTKWVKGLLRNMQEDGMVTTRSTNRFTIITICNYSSFQDKIEARERPEELPDALPEGDKRNYQTHYDIRSKEVKKLRSKEINKKDKDKNLRRVADATRQAEAVFDHWKLIMNHPGSQFDTKRKKVVKARLKEGYSVNDLKEAIEGMSNCPHNMGQNEQGIAYDRIGIVLKDAESIDRFRRMYKTPPVPNTGGMTIDQTIADGEATARRIMEHQRLMEQHEIMLTDQNNNNKIGDTYDNSKGGPE